MRLELDRNEAWVRVESERPVPAGERATLRQMTRLLPPYAVEVTDRMLALFGVVEVSWTGAVLEVTVQNRTGRLHGFWYMLRGRVPPPPGPRYDFEAPR